MKKILLIRTDRIGDVVLTTPCIELIRKAYPTIHISFLTTPQTAEILEDNPFLDEVIVYDKKNLYKNFLRTIQFARALRKKSFDVSIALNPSNRNHWISFLAGIPKRIGYNRKSSYVLTHTLPDLKGEGKKSESFYNEDLLQFMDISPKNSRNLAFHVSKRTQESVNHFLKLKGWTKPFAVMNVSASCPSKQWPSTYFSSLCDLILEKQGLFPILIGSEKTCQEVAKNMKQKAYILAESFSLKELGALLSEAKLHITADTGPMHLASAMKTPTLSLFGRTQPGLGPKRWAPLQGPHTILQKDIGCNPCLAHLCKLDFDCLKALKVEEVYRAALPYL